MELKNINVGWIEESIGRYLKELEGLALNAKYPTNFNLAQAYSFYDKYFLPILQYDFTTLEESIKDVQVVVGQMKDQLQQQGFINILNPILHNNLLRLEYITASSLKLLKDMKAWNEGVGITFTLYCSLSYKLLIEVKKLLRETIYAFIMFQYTTQEYEELVSTRNRMEQGELVDKERTLQVIKDKRGKILQSIKEDGDIMPCWNTIKELIDKAPKFALLNEVHIKAVLTFLEELEKAVRRYPPPDAHQLQYCSHLVYKILMTI